MTLTEARRLERKRCVGKAIYRKNSVSFGPKVSSVDLRSIAEARERLAEAAVSSPRVVFDDAAGKDVLIVPYDGIVAVWHKFTVAKKRAGLAPPTPTLTVAMKQPEFFWNLVHAAGGAAAMRAHDNDVLAAYDARSV